MNSWSASAVWTDVDRSREAHDDGGGPGDGHHTGPDLHVVAGVAGVGTNARVQVPTPPPKTDDGFTVVEPTLIARTSRSPRCWGVTAKVAVPFPALLTSVPSALIEIGGDDVGEAIRGDDRARAPERGDA